MVMSTSLNAANSGGLGRIGTPVGLTRSSLGTTPIGSPALNLNVSDGYGGSSGGHDLQAASLHAMQPRLDMIRMHMTSGQYKTAYEYVLKAEARQPFPDSVDWYTEVSKVFRTYSENCDPPAQFNTLAGLSVALIGSIELCLKKRLINDRDQELLTSALSNLKELDLTIGKLQRCLDANQGCQQWIIASLRLLFYYYAAALMSKRCQHDGRNVKEILRLSGYMYCLTYSSAVTDLTTESWYGLLDTNWQHIYRRINDLNGFSRFTAGLIINSMAGADRVLWLNRLVAEVANDRMKQRVSELALRSNQSPLASFSFFASDQSFQQANIDLPNPEEILNMSQTIYQARSASLNDILWIMNHMDQDFVRIVIKPDLRFSTPSLKNNGNPETLCQLDLDTFLTISALCVRETLFERDRDSDERSKILFSWVPPLIADDVATEEQRRWWHSVTDSLCGHRVKRLAEMRRNIQWGLEIIRGLGPSHGLDARLLFDTARVLSGQVNYDPVDGFTEMCDSSEQIATSAAHYWLIALDAAERPKNSQRMSSPRRVLFKYNAYIAVPQSTIEAELQSSQAEAWLFLGLYAEHCGSLDQAADYLGRVNSPEGTFNFAKVLKKIYDRSVEEAKPQSELGLIAERIRQALYATLDRVGREQSHPITSALPKLIEEAEKLVPASISSDQLDNSMTANLSSLSIEGGSTPAANKGRGIGKLGTPSASPLGAPQLKVPHYRPSPEKLEAQIKSIASTTEQQIRMLAKQQETLATQQLDGMRRLEENQKIVMSKLTAICKQVTKLTGNTEELATSQAGARRELGEVYNNMDTMRVTLAELRDSVNTLTQNYDYPDEDDEGEEGEEEVNDWEHVERKDQQNMAKSYGLKDPRLQSTAAQPALLPTPCGPTSRWGLPEAQQKAYLPRSATETKLTISGHVINQFLGNSPAANVPPQQQAAASSSSVPFTIGGGQQDTRPLSELFKKPQGAWECPACYVNNKANVDYCLSCESPNPNNPNLTSKDQASSSQPAAAAGSGFKFGFGSSPAPAPASTSSLFQPPQPTSASKPFSFASPAAPLSTQSPQSQTTPLQAPVANPQPFGSPFSFASSASKSLFGNSPDIKQEPATGTFAPLKVSPSPAAATAPQAASPKVTSSSSSSPSAEVQIVFEKKCDASKVNAARKLQLPDNFYSYENDPDCKGCVGCRDEMPRRACDAAQSSDAGDTQQPSSAAPAPVVSEASPAAAAPFNWGNVSSTSSIGAAVSPFASFTSSTSGIFAPPSSNQPQQSIFAPPATDTTTASPFGTFSFGAATAPTGDLFKDALSKTGVSSTWTTQSQASWAVDKGKPLFSATSPATGGGEASQGDDDGNMPEGADSQHDPHFEPIIPLPALVNVTTGEEDEEVIFAHRSKLFRFANETKEWKERGVGEIKILKAKDKDKFRVIFRRDQIHKIAANHYITPEMELKPMGTSEVAKMWIATDFTEGQAVSEMFAAKFKNSDIVKQFAAKFEECQAILRAQQ